MDFPSLGKYKLGVDDPTYGYWHVISETVDDIVAADSAELPVYSKESFNAIMESDEEEINDVLQSFKPHNTLEPRVWKNKKLNSRVRMRLLDIADAFIEFLNVDWADYEDIILTGSLCNYNYSKYSDFDLHIVYDFSKIDKRVEFVGEYANSKKKIWNDEHENLTIYGYPVELYVQDSNEEHTASGLYSLEKDKWLVKPEADNFNYVNLNKGLIKSKALKYMEKIDRLCNMAEKESDTHKIVEIGEKAKKLFAKIRGIRKASLEKYGEFSTGNIFFKALRRLGYIGKIAALKAVTYDKTNSIS